MTGFWGNGRARATVGALGALAIAIFTVGCGSSSPAAPKTSASRASAAVSLKRAAYVSTAAAGYKATLMLRVGVKHGPHHFTLGVTVSGSFSPAARQGDMTMAMDMPTTSMPLPGSLPGAVGIGAHRMVMQMVLDGNTVYVKMPTGMLPTQLPNGKPWLSMDLKQMAGASGYGSLFGNQSYGNPGQYLDFLRAASGGSVKDLGQETVDGVQTTHYQAQVDLAKLPDSVRAVERHAIAPLIAMLQSKGLSTQLPVDVWIDSSHHIRRLHITYDASLSGTSVAFELTGNISDYGPQPAPTIPSPSETTNLTSLMHGSLNPTTG